MLILLAQINPTVGDFPGNTAKILKGIEEGKKQGAELVVFPELCLSGYPPDDFLLLADFVSACALELEKIVPATKGIAAIVGLPRYHGNSKEKRLCNSAAVISDQKLLGFQDKALLPTYDVFDERRYFDPGEQLHIWTLGETKLGVTVCEDIWQHSELVASTSYSYDPVVDFKGKGVNLLLNISASPYSGTKFSRRIAVCQKAALSLQCPVLLCNQVGGNDGLIFDGYSFYVGADGTLKAHAKGFSEDYLLVDTESSAPTIQHKENRLDDLFHALVLGLKDYFRKLGFTKACFGLSGGIDSSLVACIAKEALGAENLLALMMPSRYSSPSSLTDARELAGKLGIATKEISIEKPYQSMLDLLEPHFENKPFDITEENLQARIRGMTLMAISNKLGYVVLSTGNKSELAMGYATLYGDMVGGLGVLSDVIKEDVYNLARWLKVIPQSIIDKPPSAELRPDQKDTDALPDYQIVDNVLREYVEEHTSSANIAKKYGYDLSLVQDLVWRIHRNEYKRRQCAPGLRVTEKAFTAGYRFPIVQKFV